MSFGVSMAVIISDLSELDRPEMLVFLGHQLEGLMLRLADRVAHRYKLGVISDLPRMKILERFDEIQSTANQALVFRSADDLSAISESFCIVGWNDQELNNLANDGFDTMPIDRPMNLVVCAGALLAPPRRISSANWQLHNGNFSRFTKGFS